jgi:hypothetical protein
LTLAISAIAATDPVRRLPRDPDLRDEDGYVLGGDGTDDERPRGRRAEEGRGGEEGEDDDDEDESGD